MALSACMSAPCKRSSNPSAGASRRVASAASNLSANARAFVGAKLADLDGSAVQSLTRSWVA